MAGSSPNVSVTGDAVGGWLVDMHDGTQRFLNWSGPAKDAADAEKKARAAWEAKYSGGAGLPATHEDAHELAQSAHDRVDEMLDNWNDFREEMRAEIAKLFARLNGLGHSSAPAAPNAPGMRVPGATGGQVAGSGVAPAADAATPMGKSREPDPDEDEDDAGAKGKGKRGKS